VAVSDYTCKRFYWWLLLLAKVFDLRYNAVMEIKDINESIIRMDSDLKAQIIALGTEIKGTVKEVSDKTDNNHDILIKHEGEISRNKDDNDGLGKRLDLLSLKLEKSDEDNQVKFSDINGQQNKWKGSIVILGIIFVAFVSYAFTKGF